MAWVTPTSRSTGDLITAAIWNQDSVDNVQFLYDNRAVRLIQSVTVGAGGAANVDFQNIPATFATLLLFWMLRGTTAATNVQARIRMNNDSSSNYDYTSVTFIESSTGYDTTRGQMYIVAGPVDAANSPANSFSAGKLEIPRYANTNYHKPCLGHTMNKRGVAADSEFYLVEFRGWWRSTAAINRLTIYPDSNNWAQHSVIDLYGVLEG